MAVGGDIIEIQYNHATLGTATIFAKADSDSNFDLGGYRSDDDAGGITGSGEMIDKITNKRWSFDVEVAWDMNTRTDLEKINALAASPVQADWTFSHINGAVYKGKGKPVGDYAGNGNAATFTLKVSGGGKLEKISG